MGHEEATARQQQALVALGTAIELLLDAGWDRVQVRAEFESLLEYAVEFRERT